MEHPPSRRKPAHRTHHCANHGLVRVGGVVFVWDGAAWSWDLEHGDDSFIGDADLGDEGFDGGLALGGGAAGDGVGQVGLEPLDCAGRRWGGFAVHGFCEFVGAGGELGDLALEGLEAGAGGGIVHGAVLERGVVAVDGGFLGLDLGEDRGVLGAPVGVSVAVACAGAGDRVGDQVTGLGVEVAEGLQDGGVGLVGGQPGGLAAVGAVAHPGEAGVVAVGAVAAGGGGADVLVAARRAGDQPGEVVAGVAEGALGVGVGAGSADGAGPLPGLAADQRLVGVLHIHLAVGDVAGVGGVGKDAHDGVPGPGLAGAVGHSAAVEFAGDGPGAVAFFDVKPEDFPQVRCFFRVRDEFLCFAVHVVPVGAGTAGPFAFAGFGGHSFGDAVDDGFPLKFREHAEQLDEHAADGGGGVERLGGRGERHPRLVQFAKQVEQVGQAAGEPVHPVDEQDIETPGFGGAQGLLEAGPVGGGAGGVVGEGGDQGPAGLGGDVGAQGGFLGADGERLVLVVGRAAQVDRHPARPGWDVTEAGGCALALASALRCRWGGG